MKTYRFSILCLVAFAIAYPLISGSALVLGWGGERGDEIFPVAPWTLFCFVPNHETDYAVRLTAMDGRPLDPPRFFEDLPEFNETQEIVAVHIIEEMGRLNSHQESPEFQQQQRLFERNFLQPLTMQAEYEVVRRRYDVLERLRTGNFDSVDAIGKFAFRVDSN